MTSSINSTSSDNLQLLMQQMLQKMNTADTDGTKGLSKDELSSIDTSGDKGGSEFLKSLQSQFDSLDTDGNGELSSKEISSAKPVSGQMGPPPGMQIESSDDSSSTTITGSTSSTSTTESTSTTSSTSDAIEEWIKELIEKTTMEMTSGATAAATDSSSNSDKASSLISSADSDSSGGLSVSELSSADNSGSTGKTGFVNDLIQNFKSYDTNGDGSLSQSEIEASMPNKTAAGDLSSLSDSVGNLTSAFIEKLISNYQDGGLSNLASTVGIAS